eukprot:TRINITY_DN64629_c0_g1_i1.p1 TRINITY_DN64629_c0_g1~~TRINITY_DN64629_c0_g1_i1.p1  ORF type:complete len:422 (+),score=38.95 TRINITY_DN64629_c0_g1_i1:71-1336(+)
MIARFLARVSRWCQLSNGMSAASPSGLGGVAAAEGLQPSLSEATGSVGPTPEVSATFTMACDTNFNIAAVDPIACQLLQYKAGDLVGRSVLCLMSHGVAEIHSHIFTSLRRASVDERRRIAKRVLREGKHSISEFIIIGADGSPVKCALSLVLNDDLSSQVKGETVQKTLTQAVPKLFREDLHGDTAVNVKDYNDVVCIMLDVAGSTRFAVSHAPRVMAELFHQMYIITEDLVLRTMYPYGYIHEVVGDSILLVVNAGFMVPATSLASHITVDIAFKLQNSLDLMFSSYDPELYCRMGISIGPVCAGVVSSSYFRLFGATVHLSQRLEASCPRSKIACSAAFVQSLDQDELTGTTKELRTAEFKGFSMMDFFILSKAPEAVSKYDPDLEIPADAAWQPLLPSLLHSAQIGRFAMSQPMSKA